MPCRIPIFVDFVVPRAVRYKEELGSTYELCGVGIRVNDISWL